MADVVRWWEDFSRRPPRGAGEWAAAAGLLPLSVIYGAGAAAHRAMFSARVLRRVRVDGVRIVSVGNLTVGGNTKTPMAAALARRLHDAGAPVCIVSYGYGAPRSGGFCVVSNGSEIVARLEDSGDEAMMLARLHPAIPVLTARRRQVAVEFARDNLGARVAVLDDAFQYPRLERDVDIVMLDGERPFGNGLVFPAGPLREWKRALSRAQFVISVGEKLPNARACARLVPTTHVNLDLADPKPLEELRGVKAAAVCAIGTPQRFRASLEEAGANVVHLATFPDHHAYRMNEIEDFTEVAYLADADLFLTTAKDAVKLKAMVPESARERWRVLLVDLELDPADAWDDLLAAVLERPRSNAADPTTKAAD